MSFLFPAFLLAGLAVAVPILLHFFARDRAPRLPFSDVRFLERAFVRRDRRRRLRELLLLALRVAALLLLAVAFARPFTDTAGGARRITVVVVDRSSSLSAPGQAARVRERALEVVAETPADESMAVVAFDATAEVLAGPSVGRPPVRAAIERVAPTAGATRYAAGLAAAVELLGGASGRIVVVSDLQASGWIEGELAAVPEDVDVEVAAVPPVERNLAVSAVRSDAEGLMAAILNTGPRAVETEAALSLDGREVARRRVTLDPGATDVRWDVPTAAARAAVVSVADSDGYRWDNTRHALLGAAAPTVVHVVTDTVTLDADAFYVEQALAVAPPDRPFDVHSVTPAALTATGALDWQAGDVSVVVGTDGLGRPGRARVAAFVETGGGLLLATGPAVDPRLVRDLLGASVELMVAAPAESPPDATARRLAVVDPRHPVFRPFGDLVAGFGQVQFTRTARVALPDPEDLAPGAGGPPFVLARFDNGDPALIEYRPGAGRALVLASDLGMRWNDFPRHPGFVPLLQEAVRYAAGRDELPRDMFPADVPAGVPRMPGVFRVSETGHRVAVNVDPRESEPAPLTPEGFLARLAAAPAVASGGRPASDSVTREAEQSLWWYVVLAVAVVLVGEAWLGRTMA